MLVINDLICDGDGSDDRLSLELFMLTLCDDWVNR